MTLQRLSHILGMNPHLLRLTLGDLSRFAFTGNRGGVNWMGAMWHAPATTTESEASR